MAYCTSAHETWPVVDAPHEYSDCQYTTSQQFPYYHPMEYTGDQYFEDCWSVPSTQSWEYNGSPGFQRYQQHATHPFLWTHMQAPYPKTDDDLILYNPSSGITNYLVSSIVAKYAPSTGSWDGRPSEGSSNSEFGYSPICSPGLLADDIRRPLPATAARNRWMTTSHPAHGNGGSAMDTLYSRTMSSTNDMNFMFDDTTLDHLTDSVASENAQYGEEEASHELPHTYSQVYTPQELELSTTEELDHPAEQDQVFEDDDEHYPEDGPDEKMKDDKDDPDWNYRNARTTRRVLLPKPASTRASALPKQFRRPTMSVGTDERHRISKKRAIDTNAPRPQTATKPANSRHVRRIPAFARQNSSHTAVKQKRPFPCIFHQFGCKAEFPNKNEWKRHVAYQHLQLCFYRCDIDDCNPEINAALVKPSANGNPDDVEKIYNDFNRKDLFTQHVRRMHGPSRNPELCSSAEHDGNNSTPAPTKSAKKKPSGARRSSTTGTKVTQPTAEDEARFEDLLPAIRARCWRTRRRAPSRSNCPFDDVVFDADFYTESPSSESKLPSTRPSPCPPDSNTGNSLDRSCERAWEDRMEHVGRHYEKGPHIELSEETVDDDLVAWGIENGVLHRLLNGRLWLVGLPPPSETQEEAETEAEMEVDRGVQGIRSRRPRTRQTA